MMNDSEIIETLGVSAVASICEGRDGKKITPQAVSQWKKTGIPPARRQFLMEKHPELFGAPTVEAGT